MLWWKAVHIIAVISWMAGVLYLYRLFVYHNEEAEALVARRFETMERRLFRYIATPAMLLALVSGLFMFANQPAYYLKAGWFHAKLFLLIILLFLHFWSLFFSRRLKTNARPFSNAGMRVLNELPTVLMILIVLLAVVKPF